MRRILVVSILGSDEPWLAAPTAQLAQDTGAEVTVLVVDDVESQRFTALPRDELLRLAQQTADRLAGLLEEEGVVAQPVARPGPAADAAIEFAEQIDADLVVVGATRRRGVVERLLGSLPLDLIKRSGRQVLVIAEAS